ncbi:unnamed protein product [Pedinophyceae sp. YPF-701]|nr:unnamed protein product [Pedinophyceae sp. YPF-701]
MPTKAKKPVKAELPPQEEMDKPSTPAGGMFEPPKVEIVRPTLQLSLTAEQLEEEIPRILTAKNPEAPESVVRYNAKEKQWKADAMIDQLLVHFSSEGWLISEGSEEARVQAEQQKAEAEAKQEYDREVAKRRQEQGADDEPRELRNVFNFADRAMQTNNLGMRDRAVMTDPPPLETLAGSCSFNEIYDAYIEEQIRVRLAEKAQRELGRGGKKKGGGAAAAHAADADRAEDDDGERDKGDGDVLHGREMGLAVKLMERMVNQNAYNDIFQDFKYWEDPSDKYRDGEGTMLPLWKFYHERAKRKHVTSICWSPRYGDMFAVGYGSFDFARQGSGLICVFSYKNPSWPEVAITTESGVMSLDFHPEQCNLLAVGLYDGSVLVFDVSQTHSIPLYKSSVRVGKHTDPVWQVRWQEDEAAKSLQFYSVSTDGRVLIWTVSKSGGTLECQNGMDLKLEAGDESDRDDDDALINQLAGGCCFDFNQQQDHLFVVGTEEGTVHKCSKAYASQYLDTYNAHSLPVYAVRWNCVHPRVFLSASADWSVKLWDHTNQDSFLSYDLGSPVGDAAWAPYSATVFSAVTADGKVHLFDLSQNKHEPICEQKIVRKAKLTRLAYNPNAEHPVLLVGDDHGCVTALKLSPNLHRACKPEEGQSVAEADVARMDRIIDIAFKSRAQAAAAASRQGAQSPAP